ncbi:MAG: hypothetical protein WBQ59_10420 [Candidatus Acidiferrum sp.]
MTLMSKAIPYAGLVATRPSVCRTSLTKQGQAEVQRLTETLFYRKSGLYHRSVLVVDLGGITSSLWVATSVASVLGKAIHNIVHVLAVGSDVSESYSAPGASDLDLSNGSCIVEQIGDPSSAAEGINVLTSRLSAIKAEGFMTIVHTSQLKEHH